MPNQIMTPKQERAYQLARDRIEACRRKKDTTLILTKLGLSVLPPTIGRLEGLKQLYLNGNQLSTLPPEVGDLIELTHLLVGGNHLTNLPPEVGLLDELSVLYLDDNDLSIFPPEICQLTQLRELYLNRNLLSSLPPTICELAQLRELSLKGNHLKSLPLEIGRLARLERLHLERNNLRELPKSMMSLDLLKELTLHGNEALGLPTEVLGPISAMSGAVNPPTNVRQLLERYFTHSQAAEADGAEPLMEAKVLVLGEASVGKSCLIAALGEGKSRRQLGGEGTSGIVRKLWVAPVKGEELVEHPNDEEVERLRLNCWDFGGQEIYHSAHTLFLTKRAIYLVVVSKRENERQNNVDYWLRMAASFGGSEAVTYVVVNKCDEKVGHPPDEQALRLKYPHVRGFLHTSCDDLTGIHEARQVIVREALRLEGVQLPVAKTWLGIKKRLETMPEHTLSMQEWAALCGKEVASPDAQKELLHLCDRLGTVRYFPTTKPDSADLCETAILNPEWVTLGIYALLDDGALKARGGLLNRMEMTEILKRRSYPAQHERLIEEVMRRFDLLYDSADHGAGHRMLIPLMLPEPMPAISWPVEGALEFVYQYEVMPAGLVPAFMARMHEHLTKTSPPWRHGCVLEMKWSRVRVIGDAEAKRVSISVLGKEVWQREALDQVRFAFEALHGAVDNLPVQQLIPVPRHPDAPMLDYEFVRSLEWDGTTEFKTKGRAFGQPITVYVQEALDGVRGEARRWREAEQRAARGPNHYHFYQPENAIKFMNDDHSINIGGDVTNSQVGQTLTNCTNLILEQMPGEQKDLLEELAKQVRELIAALPARKQEDAPQIAENLEMVVKQVTSPKPQRKWYDLSAGGLVEASKFVKDFSGNIAGTLTSLGKSLWPDFTLPEPE